jgi:hypothetical protein
VLSVSAVFTGTLGSVGAWVSAALDAAELFLELADDIDVIFRPTVLDVLVLEALEALELIELLLEAASFCDDVSCSVVSNVSSLLSALPPHPVSTLASTNEHMRFRLMQRDNNLGFISKISYIQQFDAHG